MPEVIPILQLIHDVAQSFQLFTDLPGVHAEEDTVGCSSALGRVVAHLFNLSPERLGVDLAVTRNDLKPGGYQVFWEERVAE